MGVQFGALARLTWWEYSWDIMEPITYFVTYGTSIAAFAYYVLTKQVRYAQFLCAASIMRYASDGPFSFRSLLNDAARRIILCIRNEKLYSNDRWVFFFLKWSLYIYANVQHFSLNIAIAQRSFWHLKKLKKTPFKVAK